jgi:5-deoxy-glucuronate isomerase
MPDFIKSYNNDNQAIVDHHSAALDLCYFNIVRLRAGEQFQLTLDRYESTWVLLSGTAHFDVNGHVFDGIGKRQSVWHGKAEAVYAPLGSTVKVEAQTDAEIAIGGGVCQEKFEPFAIRQGDVQLVDVGSSDTKSHRRIFHVLGQKDKERSSRLLVSECYTEEGCWSGYPPHKHDTENPPEETDFEEIYHYRFNPENGFGGQYYFDEDGNRLCHVMQHGDTFAFASGYHPTSTSPGHDAYIFTILVGRHQHSLIQNFQEEYRHLMDKIPGIGDMRNLFK